MREPHWTLLLDEESPPYRTGPDQEEWWEDSDVDRWDSDADMGYQEHGDNHSTIERADEEETQQEEEEEPEPPPRQASESAEPSRPHGDNHSTIRRADLSAMGLVRSHGPCTMVQGHLLVLKWKAFILMLRARQGFGGRSWRRDCRWLAGLMETAEVWGHCQRS